MRVDWKEAPRSIEEDVERRRQQNGRVDMGPEKPIHDNYGHQIPQMVDRGPETAPHPSPRMDQCARVETVGDLILSQMKELEDRLNCMRDMRNHMSQKLLDMPGSVLRSALRGLVT